MLMMRSTPAPAKMAKPPPPVPPRPSKSIVQEALAKSRRHEPNRMAPPPPIAKSQSPIVVNGTTPSLKPIPLERSISEEVKCSSRTVIFQSPKIEKKDSFKVMKEPKIEEDEKNWDQLLNDRNHVNTLIDEMFASVLEVSEDNTVTIINNNNTEEDEKEVPSATVVVIEDNHVDGASSNSSTISDKKKVQFDDRMNHELLISELETMRIEDEKILKRQRMPSRDIYENGDKSAVDVSKIQHSDWVEVNDGQEVRLSSCQITIDDLKNEHSGKELKLDYERIRTMSSLHGLPPLPKSLSGFNLLDGQAKPPTPIRSSSMRSQQGPTLGHLVYPPHPKSGEVTPGSGRKATNLDTQLAILRREMYSLRQLDLSLLSQLWSLNESIQDFRHILQDQDDRVLSPPSPSPSPSSGDEDEFYMSTSSMNFRTPPPPPARKPSSSSNASSLG